MRMRLVLRSLVRQPVVALTVVVTIGLAVATNASLFSILDGLLLRPLPYRNSDRIVHLELERSARLSRARFGLEALIERVASTPSLIERADARPALLFDPTGSATIDWQIRPSFISPSAFELLGVSPLLGRAFREQDRHDPRYVVLLGYDLWKTRFGGDVSIVGRLVEIPSASPELHWRIVGVMPEGFSFPEGANFWVPTYPSYAAPSVMPYARLAPGVTIQSVRAELAGIAITRLRERVRPRGALGLAVLLVASALLFLVALVQVAGLLFAQAAGRVTEIGVQLALGASRAQVVRDFALKGGVLVLLALGFALWLTPSLTALIIRALPLEVTVGQYLEPDGRAFTGAALTAAFGLFALTILPVNLIRRTTPLGLLRGQALGDARILARRVGTGLFAAQLAIVTVLVYLTALTFQSFVRVTNADLGFDTSGLIGIPMPRGDGLVIGGGKRQLTRQRELVAETVTTLRAIPGVRVVAGSHSWPMQPGGLLPESLSSTSDVNRFPTPGKYCVITRGFPAVLGLGTLSGDEPSDAELIALGAHFPPRDQLALANLALARQLERFAPPIGQIVAGRFRIVGVIPDVKLESADRPVEPTVFHYLPPPAAPAVLLVRLAPGRTVEDTGIPVALSRIWGRFAPTPFTIDQAIRLSARDQRARTFLLGFVSVLTIPLAVLGAAGTLAFTVRERTRDIAIHLAMGAQPRQIEWRVVQHALAAAGIALAAGLSAGIGLGTLMRGTLFGVVLVEPSAIGASILLVLAVISIAAFLPARRASRVNVVQALRES